MSLCLILLILSKTDLMHIGNRDFFISLSSNLYRNRRLEIRIYVESIFGPYLSMLSIRKLMSVVKDVDLEAMPSSIFVNDDDDDDDDD